MRCFIGVDLAVSEKLALDSWRQQALPEISTKMPSTEFSGKSKSKNGKQKAASHPYAVDAANYHITLCFLGQITPRQHEALVSELDEVTHSPFSIDLDSSGIWNGPKILFAAPSSPPNELMQLARSTRKAARRAAIEIDGREYKPHVTVVRKATAALPMPLYTPHIDVHASAFHLFESVSTPQGIRYPIRQSWPLKHAMTVREKLRRGITDE
jgi:2'-5' RNA ligase